MSVRCCRRAHFSTVRCVTTSIDSATWWSDDWASRVIDVGVAVTNLSVYLAASAKNSPDARAVVSDDTTTTYWKLGNDVARFADYLTDAGLRPGDRVGVMLPNGLDFATIFYGVLHAGGVVVLLNPRLHARAVDFFSRSRARDCCWSRHSTRLPIPSPPSLPVCNPSRWEATGSP